MVHINLKIKTLENGDTLISVDDELSLSEFRTFVENVTSIKKESQRLIFRGRALIDDARTLKSYGLENEMAVHVVKRPSAPLRTTNDADTAQHQSSQSENSPSTFDEHHHHSHVNSHNIIVGTVPFERTSIFNDPEQTLTIIRSLLAELGNSFNIVSDVSLQNPSGPQENIDNFTINVVLRGNRDSTVDSPAFERFEQLQKDLRKLAWMTATVQALFNRHVDTLLDNNFRPPSLPYVALASILQGMHGLDQMSVNELRTICSGVEVNEENILIKIADEIASWRLPEDEQHLQLMDNNITMRHVVADDLAMLLRQLEIVDSQISTHLTSRYIRVLGIQHVHEISSFTSRLLNCFTSAFSRIQHVRSHLYHNIGDFGVHVDANPMNRIFPQYIVYERDDSPEANIMFTFNRPSPPTTTTATTGVTTSSTTNRGGTTSMSSTTLPSSSLISSNTSTGNRVVSSIQQFLQRAGAPFHTSTDNSSSNSAQSNRNLTPNTATNTQTDNTTSNPYIQSLRLGGTQSGNLISTFGGGNMMGSLQGFRVPFLPRAGGTIGTQGISGIASITPLSGLSMATFAPQMSQQRPENHGNEAEPMDTGDTNTNWFGGNNNNNTGGTQQQRQPLMFGFPQQSLNLGQALSEFMTLASQFSDSPVTSTSNIGGETTRTNQNSTTSDTQNSNAQSSTNQSGGPIPSVIPPLPLNARSNSRIITQPNTGRYDSSLVGWRQLPSTSPNALFIGPRPPSSMPMYTNDPYLPCSSRRLRNFELDARHNDFWNDPSTISSGLYRRNSNSNVTTTNDNTSISEGRPSALNNTETVGETGNNNSDSTSTRDRRNVEVRVNNNGEAVFTDEQSFRDYLFSTFEQVALSMGDFQPTILRAQQQQQQQSPLLLANETTQVHGYVPIVGRPFLSAPGMGGFQSIGNSGPAIEGIISITAEIPLNLPLATTTVVGNNGAGSSQNNANSDSGNNTQQQRQQSAASNTIRSTTEINRNNNRNPTTEANSNSANNSGNLRRNNFANDLDEMD